MDTFDSAKIRNAAKICYYAVLAVVVLVPLAYFAKFFGLPPSDNQGIWGQFGDYMGGVLNPLLSFFSLMAILVTLHLQMKQTEIAMSALVQAQEDSKESRAELVRTSTSLASINLEQKRQSDAAFVAMELSALTATLSVLDAALNREERMGNILSSPRRAEMHSQREKVTARILILTDTVKRHSPSDNQIQP